MCRCDVKPKKQTNKSSSSSSKIDCCGTIFLISIKQEEAFVYAGPKTPK
jgi:hypothetical protein